MNRWHVYISLLLLFLVACAPAATSTLATTPPTIPTATPVATNTPTPEPTPTITPTNTSIPLVNLEGLLFFDYNGSGLREDNEPPITNFGICAKVAEQEVCTDIDEDGRYIFEELAPANERVSLNFVDPNADEPALAFRYINLWKGSVVIPAYEVNGVQVPEQHLNDTEVLPLQSSVTVNAGRFHETGLMQGFLSWPVDQEGSYISTFYDHNPTVGGVLDWRGNTIMGMCNQYTWPVNGICEDHDGTDFITFPTDSLAESFDIRDNGTGAPVWASLAGTVNWAKPVGAGSLHVTLDHSVDHHPYQTGYSHLSVIFVQFGQKVYRGQLVGLVGSSGTSGPHLHFNLHDNTVFREDGSPVTLDPWGDPGGLYFPFWMEFPDPTDFPLRNNR